MFIERSAWLSSIFLAFLLISFFAADSSGLSLSCTYDGGSGTISNSQNYNLDSSTAMKSTTILEGSSMQQTILANGKGQNSLGQQITGNLYSSENILSSSGSFDVSSSAVASSTSSSLSQSVSSLGESTLGQSVAGEGYALQNSVTSSGLLSDSGSFSASADRGSMNQQLVGGGNVDLTMSGLKGEDYSGQKASVDAGLMVSAQDISAGQGVSSSQSTTISGEAGSLGSGALSSNSMMLVTGSFERSGSLNAELNTGAEGQAYAHGKVSVNGGTLIDDSTIQNVGKESIGMNVEGLTAAPDGSTGSFGAGVVNMNWADGKLAGTSGVAAAQAQTGYNLWTVSRNGVTLPMKWITNNPQIQLYLDGSSVPNNLNQEDVKTAISSAANTWDKTVAQNLFAAGHIVTIDNTKPVFPAESPNPVGYNSQGWRSMSYNENPNGRTLAITYNWFGAAVNGYYSILESDTAFNNAQTWSTTGSNYDVQSVSLHELGHTIGLGHISDTSQIMNPVYTGNRYLGPGDTAGAQFLYGFASDKLGVYYPTYGNFYLDTNSDNIWDTAYHMGGTGDLPVTGDWNGNSRDGLGVYYPPAGAFYLDTNSDNIWDKAVPMGGTGDLPVSGDWNGDGKNEPGVYYPTYGNFYLDTNGDGNWDKVVPMGGTGDLPVSGDWNGDGRDELGVYYPPAGAFYLDTNSDNIWDKAVPMGGTDDLPVIGNWNGNGRDELGVYYPTYGNFYLDTNKDNIWDTVVQMGGTGDLPVSGNWIGSN